MIFFLFFLKKQKEPLQMQEILLKMVIHKSLLYAFFVFLVFENLY